MRKKIKRYSREFYNSLSFKLFGLLFFMVLLILGLYAGLCSTMQKKISENIVQRSAYLVSDVVKKSLYRLMLTNERDALYQTILLIGSEPGIESIRIFNKKGEIKFSTKKGESGKVVDMKAEACFVCHTANQPLTSLPIQEKTRIYRTTGGDRVMGMINPITNAQECSNRLCHAHQPSQTILGVLDVRMSLKELDQAVWKIRFKVFSYSIVFIFIAMFLFSLLFYLIIYRPINELKEGTVRLALGDLEYRIQTQRRDELGMLARSFNNMAGNLKHAYDELKDWSYKMAQRVNEKTAELERMHHGMLQIEKMASLGKMAATVAHELNNPLSGIVTYAKVLQKRIDKNFAHSADKEKYLQDLELIRSESLRCGKIVSDLLAFARGSTAKYQECTLKEIVDRAMNIVRHHIELAGIEAESQINIQPEKIKCDPDQFLQALVALLINAVEAMPNGGELKVRAENLEKKPGYVLLSISDSGSGIPDEIKDKIFDPFFSTKKDQKGVGLGLTVVYGIVQRHGGKIWAESSEQKGTIFFIELPVQSPQITENPNEKETI